MAGEVEGQGHPAIEELRLALSKKDFGGSADPDANRWMNPVGRTRTGHPRGILSSTKSAKLIASSTFAPQGATQTHCDLI